MRIARRPLGPGELDHELVWLAVSLGSLMLAAIWFKLHFPWPHCLFLAITGHPCLTCGATRSTIAFIHGDFWSALKWNPAFFVFLCGLSIFDAYAFVALTARTRRLRIVQATPAQKRFVRVIFVIALFSNWVYLLTRPVGLF
jgi:hypothetical protein